MLRPHTVVGLTLAALFILLNGFFVAAEFALVKLRATRATQQVAGYDAAVTHIVARLDRYLGVTQLGITLASLGLGWVGEPAVAAVGESLLLRLTGHELGSGGKGVMFAVAFALLTLAHVLFGELVPKLVAIQRSRETVAAAAPLLKVLDVVLYPPLWLLDLGSRAVLKAVGLPFDAYGEAALSEDEILSIIAANVARGPRGQAKRELLRRVMRFSERTAKVAMVPRVDVAALPIETPGAKAIEYMRQQQYSRILLLDGASLDKPLGYVYVKDLLFDPKAERLSDLRSLRRELLFVPETEGLDDVLKDMQRKQAPFAVVVDEYGGTSGIVTMEDLLEEIVGEIRDELDIEAMRIERRADGWEVDGGVTLDELAAVTGVEAPKDERGDSIGAAVVARLERLPRIGDEVELGGVKAEVMSVSRRRVTRVRVRQPAA